MMHPEKETDGKRSKTTMMKKDGRDTKYYGGRDENHERKGKKHVTVTGHIREKGRRERGRKKLNCLLPVTVMKETGRGGGPVELRQNEHDRRICLICYACRKCHDGPTDRGCNVRQRGNGEGTWW